MRLLNNCRGYEHEKFYGEGYFFDVYAESRNHNKLKDLKKGEICAVLGKKKNLFTIKLYTYKEYKHVCIDDNSVVVFRGETSSASREFTKEAILEHPVFSKFFNKIGHVQQRAVI